MDNSKKSVLTGMLAGMALMMSGCSTMGTEHKADEQAVTCSKCQTVWISRPHQVGKSPMTVYTKEKKMVCPDCESAVKNFFTTGNLGHTCKACGGTMTACPLCK